MFSFFLSFLVTISYVLSFVIPLVRIYSFSGQAWAEAKGNLQRAAHIARAAAGNQTNNVCRHSLHRLNASSLSKFMIKPKKKRRSV